MHAARGVELELVGVAAQAEKPRRVGRFRRPRRPARFAVLVEADYVFHGQFRIAHTWAYIRLRKQNSNAEVLCRREQGTACQGVTSCRSLNPSCSISTAAVSRAHSTGCRFR